MDLLGSILGSMQKPPTMGDAERKKAREQKALFEKHQEREKKKLQEFREKTQKRIHDFIKDGKLQKFKFETMDKVYRTIVHEVADVAGLTSFSFGIEEQDRYVMVWKKEFAPTDDEINAYKAGQEWDESKAKELEKQRALQQLSRRRTAIKAELDRLSATQDQSHKKTVIPNSNYKDKYKHLIGDEAAKSGARDLTANRSYGFVPSENKRDHRTIEEVLAETRAKKKLKTDQITNVTNDTSSQNPSLNIAPTSQDNSQSQSNSSNSKTDNTLKSSLPSS